MTDIPGQSYISTVILPSNPSVTHYIKDSEARSAITDLEKAIAGGTHFIGVTTSEIADGSTLNPITIVGKSDPVTAVKGDIVLKNRAAGTTGDTTKEFIWDGGYWRDIGCEGILGSLAYKNSASGSVTANGSVAVGSITPSGTITKPAVDVSVTGSNVNIPTFAVANEVLTISSAATTVTPTVSAELHETPGFTGTPVTPTATFTPSATTVTVS